MKSEHQDHSFWWKGAVIYQVYLRSFFDVNGDGVGDLQGVIRKLDYIESLGVEAIWVSPFYVSPMTDFGYDVADYCDVDPIFGSIKDFEELLDQCHRRGIKVVIDQVLSHTSVEHSWFKESESSHDNEYSDWYVWSDPKADGSPPNNWLSLFGASAWVWSSRRRQYYLRKFLTCQPALNFHNPEVRKAQLKNVEFWLGKGVDGIRLDVINFIFHSRGLEDNPAISVDECNTIQASAHMPYSYQKHVFDITQPETAGYLQELRQLLDKYSAVSMGEISAVDPVDVLAEYTSGDNKLHMAYTFSLLRKRNSSDYITGVVQETEAKIKDGWPCWALSNHDVVRSVTRWGDSEDPHKYPLVLLAMLLTLKGSVCIYQGEELGFIDSDLPQEVIKDPLAEPYWPEYKGRDGCRTPLAWDDSVNSGFSSGKPWLPIDPAHTENNIAKQIDDENSILNFVKNFIRWRNQHPVLRLGSIKVWDTHSDVLAWTRDFNSDRLFAAFNLTADAVEIENIPRVKNVLSGHGFSGKLAQGKIELGPYQAFFAYI